MDELMSDTQFLIQEVNTTCTRIVQQCIIDQSTATRLITEGDTFQNGIFIGFEANNLNQSFLIETQAAQVEELSTKNSIISLIQALYEIQKQHIINCYVSQAGLTSCWEDSDSGVEYSDSGK